MSGGFGLFEGIFAVTLIGIAVIGVLTVAMVIWVFRRVMRAPEDMARAELERRMAAGEISPIEYEARLDALRRR